MSNQEPETEEYDPHIILLVALAESGSEIIQLAGKIRGFWGRADVHDSIRDRGVISEARHAIARLNAALAEYENKTMPVEEGRAS